MPSLLSQLTYLLILCCLALSACSTPYKNMPTEPVPSTWQRHPSFEHADQVLTGLIWPLGDDDTSWVAGDTVLYGIRVDSPRVDEVWYMQITVMPPETYIEGIRATELPPRLTQWLRHVQITKDNGSNIDHTVYFEELTQLWPLKFDLYDQMGELVESSITVTSPEYLMRDLHQFAAPHGPDPPTRVLHWQQAGRSMDALDEAIRSQMREYSQVVASLHTIATTYVSAKALIEMRESAGSVVIKRPGLIDLPWLASIMSGGPMMLIEPDFANARPVAIPWLKEAGLHEGYAIDVNFEIQDRQVMRINVVAIPPIRPLECTAGIAELRAWHLDDPDRRFFMQLLAAHPGTQDAQDRSPGIEATTP